MYSLFFFLIGLIRCLRFLMWCHFPGSAEVEGFQTNHIFMISRKNSSKEKRHKTCRSVLVRDILRWQGSRHAEHFCLCRFVWLELNVRLQAGERGSPRCPEQPIQRVRRRRVRRLPQGSGGHVPRLEGQEVEEQRKSLSYKSKCRTTGQ